MMNVAAERLAATLLRSQGLSWSQVAYRLGVSKTKARCLADPDYRKRSRCLSREAKRRRLGVCEDCGSRTRYNGTTTNGPSRVCGACSRRMQKANARWTTDSVVGAIRTFYAANGRPPVSAEWTRSDPVNGYPARTSVYRSTVTSGAPFASWADAIEAAGFHRPHYGTRREKAKP